MPNLSFSFSLNRSRSRSRSLNIYLTTRFRLSNMSPARLSPMTHNRRTPSTPNPSLTLNKLRPHQDRSTTTPTVIMMIPTSKLGPSTTPQGETIQQALCTLLVYLGSRLLLVVIQVPNSRTSLRANSRANNRKGTRAQRKVNPLLGPLNNPSMDTRKQWKAWGSVLRAPLRWGAAWECTRDTNPSER